MIIVPLCWYNTSNNDRFLLKSYYNKVSDTLLDHKSENTSSSFEFGINNFLYNKKSSIYTKSYIINYNSIKSDEA